MTVKFSNIHIPESTSSIFSDCDQIIVLKHKRKEAEIFSSFIRNDEYCEKLKHEDLYSGLEDILANAWFLVMDISE